MYIYYLAFIHPLIVGVLWLPEAQKSHFDILVSFFFWNIYLKWDSMIIWQVYFGATVILCSLQNITVCLSDVELLCLKIVDHSCDMICKYFLIVSRLSFYCFAVPVLGILHFLYFIYKFMMADILMFYMKKIRFKKSVSLYMQ